MDFISQPWPWYVAGPMISLVLFLLYYLGKSFGVSSNLETLCALGGAGNFSDYFKSLDWRKNSWNLLFIIGAILGGFITYQWLTPTEQIALNPQTIEDLREIGFQNAGAQYLPDEIFGMDALFSIKGLILLLVGGALVGFGARYAGGCTSGHAIVGLSNLELPSLISVIGFFIGGLLMTWIILPLLF
tara:strand:- start:101043 stop:101603 length:561 start_codon:yes stop_codon:yes gene_type:complete